MKTSKNINISKKIKRNGIRKETQTFGSFITVEKRLYYSLTDIAGYGDWNFSILEIL